MSIWSSLIDLDWGWYVLTAALITAWALAWIARHPHIDHVAAPITLDSEIEVTDEETRYIESHPDFCNTILDRMHTPAAVIDADLLPDIERVQIINIKPDDVLVITSKLELSREHMEAIRSDVSRSFPGVRVLVLDPNLTLEVALREQAEA